MYVVHQFCFVIPMCSILKLVSVLLSKESTLKGSKMSHILRIAEAQNYRCCYCGHPMLRHQHIDGKSTPRNAMTKDHVEPRAYGGETNTNNLVAACCQCNCLRGEIEAVAFYNLMQKWFKRDASLLIRWHQLSQQELFELKVQCIQVHERQLKGLAVKYIEYAFRHVVFTHQRRRQLAHT